MILIFGWIKEFAYVVKKKQMWLKKEKIIVAIVGFNIFLAKLWSNMKKGKTN